MKDRAGARRLSAGLSIAAAVICFLVTALSSSPSLALLMSILAGALTMLLFSAYFDLSYRRTLNRLDTAISGEVLWWENASIADPNRQLGRDGVMALTAGQLYFLPTKSGAPVEALEIRDITMLRTKSDGRGPFSTLEVKTLDGLSLTLMAAEDKINLLKQKLLEAKPSIVITKARQ